ncbi:hypothetical protein [Wenzhouxiangella sp. XN24]|uniref:hypothetical protein n=1 Tax=Wenzhouxiangella sp. XN24 TaxID=2713569 RepID=UPI0013EA68DC|nr:hypothetical protein [Wenzhouxiangella sp. XN24]NGX15133.1 hypothetical protein [Wenzhouxiangella sp. XN24]
MKKQHGFTILAAMAVGAVGLSLGLSQPLGADDETADNPGTEQIGAYPHGCVDCHTSDEAGDLDELLTEIGHPPVDDIEIIPDGCIECHSDEGGFWPMDELTHLAHFSHPPENAFLTDYDADCLHCHAMDMETGAVTVKSGPAER